MDFLADVWTTCDDCGGARYKPEVLKIEYGGKTIAEVLSLTASEARAFFSDHRPLERSLGVIEEIGLGYIQLGQPLDTFSGGEAQRLKLAARLMKPAPGNCLYLFDEPTTGLHFADIENLLQVFARLIGQGHTLVVIEHNLDIIARAHRIIDLGPEGGDEGGRVVARGTPAEIAACPASYTGAALKNWDQT
jgi:excinuclease ABC subunit A